MTQSVLQSISAADLPERGQPLAGGIYVTRYWLNGQERALIQLGDELEGVWGEYGVEIPGADSYSDGEANTRAMAEAGCEIAIKALELGAFIPSCLEGQLVMAAKAEGLVTLREDRYHWLSTQFSAYNAYSMGFEVGWLGNDLKSTSVSSAPSAAFLFSNSPLHSFLCRRFRVRRNGDQSRSTSGSAGRLPLLSSGTTSWNTRH
ncbi:hypothetical protein [Pseudomonas sp.]|uniref:hypothetical protein n=1 Tax=Pseudomonas sp. TaxID=306 RepID=UPI003C756889